MTIQRDALIDACWVHHEIKWVLQLIRNDMEDAVPEIILNIDTEELFRSYSISLNFTVNSSEKSFDFISTKVKINFEELAA